MEITEKLRKLITKNLTVFEDEAEFTDEDNIFELGFVNSLFAVKLVDYIETEFDIEVDNDDLNIANFNSINNIINFLEKKNVVVTG